MEAFRCFVTEIGFPQTEPSPLFCDNSGTVLKAQSAGSDKRSLYLKRRVSFVQEAQAAGSVSVLDIDTSINRADVLTKALKDIFYDMMRMLHNLCDASIKFVASQYK